MSDTPSTPSVGGAAKGAALAVLANPMVLLIVGGVALVALIGKRLGGAVQGIGEGAGQGIRGIARGSAEGTVDIARTVAVGARDLGRELSEGEEIAYDAALELASKPEARALPAWAKAGEVSGKIDSVSVAQDDVRTKYEVRYTVGNFTDKPATAGSVVQLHALFFGSRTQRETPSVTDRLQAGQVQSHAKILEGPVVDAVNETYVKLFVNGRETDRRYV